MSSGGVIDVVRGIGLIAVASVAVLFTVGQGDAESGTGVDKQAGVAVQAAGSVRVPPGFRAKEATTTEPYTDTGWAKEVIHEKTGIEMVFIPAGEFDMGTPDAEKSRNSDEGPVHHVRITKPFYMGKYEVTNAQYRRYKPGHDSKSFRGLSLNGDDQPAVDVTWGDAKLFCEWTESGLRLPTEAQWEYACRAGTRTRFWWGETESDAGKYANVADQTMKTRLLAGLEKDLSVIFETDDGCAVDAPVGRYAGNAWGLHDMIGNVWEWCEDWLDKSYYAVSPADDPRGPVSGQRHVVRGGSYLSHASNCRSGDRNDCGRYDSVLLGGFRVAGGLELRPRTTATPEDTPVTP